MKLCFSTLGCTDWSIDRVINLANRYGIKSLELRGLEDTLELAEISAFSQENREETKRKLGDIGVLVFGSSLTMDSSVREEELFPAGYTLIDRVSVLGIPYIRVFGNMVYEGEDEETAMAAIAGRLKRLSDYAAQKNITILIETHGNITTLARLRYLQEHVVSDGFGILWDVAHTDKEFKDGFRDFYLPLLPLIRHVHIKDHIRTEDGTLLVCVGKGEIPLREIAQSLIADHYQGAFSLEWEKKWHPELCDMDVALADFVSFYKEV